MLKLSDVFLKPSSQVARYTASDWMSPMTLLLFRLNDSQIMFHSECLGTNFTTSNLKCCRMPFVALFRATKVPLSDSSIDVVAGALQNLNASAYDDKEKLFTPS